MTKTSTVHRIHTRDGDTEWSDGRLLHRHDGPAVERADGTLEWWQHGYLHRDDGPAVRTPAGDLTYYSRGRLHRDGGPARVLANGDREWFRNGYRHRLDGPAVVHTSGRREHWIDGRLAHTPRAMVLLRDAFEARTLRHDECDSAHACQGVPLPAPRTTRAVMPWDAPLVPTQRTGAGTPQAA